MSRHLVRALAVAALLSSCSSDPPRDRKPIQTDVVPDASTTEEDMAVDMNCAEAETAAELCEAAGYTCGPLETEDSCGALRRVDSCGECEAPDSCGAGGTEGMCGCVAETDAEFCARLGANCGKLIDTDNCGDNREVEDCGACAAPEICGGGGVENDCGCTSETDAEMCERLGIECGPLDAMDDCGAPRSIPTCGVEADVCEEFTTCGGGGTDGVCGCTPETDVEMCARLSYECGMLDDVDNCGVPRVIDDCGDEATVCGAFETCGGAGTAGTCGCTPETCETLGVLCGEVEDGCGNTIMCDEFCVTEISAGAEHNCALGSDKLKCWGNGSDGALGTGGTTTEKNPVDVIGLTDVAALAAGGHHTCALTASQSVVCWGKNDRSQLGLGNTVNSREPGAAAITSGADQITSGQEHSCARSGDKLECWGSNEYGQIGDSAFNIDANVGVPSMPAGLDMGVRDVAAGAFHTCVIQDVPPQVGVVKCWGRNEYAQSGRFTNPAGYRGPNWWGYLTTDDWDLITLINEPTVVTDPTNAPFTNVKAVAAGDRHTCIIDASDQVWCWGTMPALDKASCPTINDKVTSDCAIFPTSGIGVGSVRLVDDGNGNDVPEISSLKGIWVAEVPTMVTTPTDKIPVELGAGGDHHCMRVSNPEVGDSNVYCWGNSTFGQLGDGTNNHWAAPRLVIADTGGEPVTSSQLSLGAEHTCALIDDNAIRCWGSNAKSQIGNSALLRDETYRPFEVLLAFP